MEHKGLLEVRNLKKYFDTNRGPLQAVDNISFSIEKGRTLGVVGESGCGKSTLGRTILRLQEPTSGEIWFNGEDIVKYDKKQVKALRSKMQIIFQDPYSSLNPRMTVSQAIEAPLVLQGIYKKNDREGLQKKVREMMDLVGLAYRFANSYPQSPGSESGICCLRRAGIGPGCVHPGPGTESDAGSSGADGAYISVHHT